MKFYFVHRPSLRGTTLPVYYYTFAESEEEAIHKVTLKWGEIDKYTTAREIAGDDLNKIVIALDNYFG